MKRPLKSVGKPFKLGGLFSNIHIQPVIDELWSDFDFEVPLLPEKSALLQDLESHHLSRSFTEPESLLVERSRHEVQIGTLSKGSGLDWKRILSQERLIW